MYVRAVSLSLSLLLSINSKLTQLYGSNVPREPPNPTRLNATENFYLLYYVCYSYYIYLGRLQLLFDSFERCKLIRRVALVVPGLSESK